MQAGHKPTSMILRRELWSGVFPSSIYGRKHYIYKGEHNELSIPLKLPHLLTTYILLVDIEFLPLTNKMANRLLDSIKGKAKETVESLPADMARLSFATGTDSK